MRKGEQTRRVIIEKTAVLFNEKGYASTSMADVTAATGVQRGGIYNHFAGKEELARASFAHATRCISQRLRQALRGVTDPVERLLAICDAFAGMYAEERPFPNGCPVLNTAVEAKGEWAALREEARRAADKLCRLIADTVRDAREQRRFASAVDPDEVASIVVGMLEGGVLLTVLYDAPVHLERAAAHLRTYVEGLRTE